jgi:phospholipid-translocating ATPase
MRIGIHTGSITAGIIGTKIVRYDIFGIDNVIANKMESEGETGKVNISEDTKRLIEDNDLELPFTTTYHKTVQVNVANRSIKCFLCHFDDNKEPAS